ncbi:MAG: sigma-54-dependent Fis family transcriptional regulator [Desulfatitalea sp.]|nr:sigma-54 dependent transcriptional regulator [Desulfatitalea sp.]NNK01912.1 sigma-54-dependent Fis family transcriptional regulator [Desulfatitalea sp.]
MTMSRPPKILIVDDDAGHLTTLKTVIGSWRYAVQTAEDGRQAVAMVKAEPFDLVLTDVRMADVDGMAALEQIKAYNPAIPVIIMTAYSSVASAVQALKAGAYDYLIKPLDFQELKITIGRACEHAGLKEENRRLKARLDGRSACDDIIGHSQAMKAMLEMAAMAAASDATVLIEGESGTGKELVARFIHHRSPRHAHPLVVVNCAAVTETLLESELFGHEKGAFTGADKRREGRFSQANEGTLFLDEIGETSPAMQTKLLRAIQEKEIQRVGGEQAVTVDVRIVAATHRNLEKDATAGRFREDLYYRLNVIKLRIPPLRERKDDIPLLAQHFLTRYARRNRKDIRGFVPLAMDLLINHHWPGNVRELENAVERAVVLMTGEFITERQLPFNIAGEPAAENPAAARPALPTAGTRSLDQIEKEVILTTLKATDGNKSETARRLGITRKTLHNKLRSYEADVP